MGGERGRDDHPLAVGVHGRVVPLVVRLRRDGQHRRGLGPRRRSTARSRSRSTPATRRTSRPAAGAPGPSTSTSASTRCCGCRCRGRWPTCPRCWGSASTRVREALRHRPPGRPTRLGAAAGARRARADRPRVLGTGRRPRRGRRGLRARRAPRARRGDRAHRRPDLVAGRHRPRHRRHDGGVRRRDHGDRRGRRLRRGPADRVRRRRPPPVRCTSARPRRSWSPCSSTRRSTPAWSHDQQTHRHPRARRTGPRTSWSAPPVPTRERSSPAPRTGRSGGSATTAAQVDKVADTGGRPLGIEIDLDGRLLGLRRAPGRAPGRHRAPAAVEAGGRQRGRDQDGVLQQRRRSPPTAPSGSRTPPSTSASSEWKADFVQDTRTGRLLRRDPDGTITVVDEGLAVRQRRRAVRGRGLRRRRRDRRPHRRPALADRGQGRPARPPVPGPARLPRQHRPRQRRADLGDHRHPARPARRAAAAQVRMWLRRQVTRIPEKLQPKPKRTIRVQAYDDAGTLVHDVDVKDGRLPHGHGRPGARRPGLDGQPARARRRRPRSLIAASSP